jgi:pilus assembly protein FimV
LAFSKEKAHDRAERFAAKGQHDRAAKEYLAIVEHDPKDVRAWLMLADCLVRCGDRAGAIERYLQVAGFYASQKQPQKAVAVYRQVLNLDPSRLDILSKCAALNLEIGRTSEAVAAYEQVGHAQLQSGHIAEALHTFALIADADPTAVSKRLRLAELYSREKQVDEAVEAFRKAGEELLRTDRKADFVRVAERLIYHRNDDKPTIRTLARVYLELGDARRALVKLNGLLHSDPHDKEGLELLAETFVVLKKPDKAVSVLVELVKGVRADPGGDAEAVRVLERGLTWVPGDTTLLRLQQEISGIEPSRSVVALAVEEGADDVEELELDDDDVVELDDDDVVLSESTAERMPSDGVPVQARGESLTDTVMLEADGPATATPEVEGQTDVDKILFEARVYIKYRLFEHALDHIRDALEQDSQHVGALGLQARALGELGRDHESADAHVALARVVVGRDPKLAREHLQAALHKTPNHLGAIALLEDLGAAVPAAPTEEPPTEDMALGAHDPGPAEDDVTDLLALAHADAGSAEAFLEAADDGDSGAFDLISDDGSAEVVIARAGESPPADDEADDFDISVAEPEEEIDEPTRPMTIENRFGLSEAGPLPLESTTDGPASLRESDRISTHGFTSRSPADAGEAGAADSESVESEAHAGLLGALDDEFEDLMLEQAEEVDGGELGGTAALQADPIATEPASTTPPSEPEPTGPEPTPAAETSWPDISDDLAEIRFYLDQGLDEDAEAALEDLRRKHGEHPDIVAIELEMGNVTAEPVTDEGAAPLVLLDDEDAEADAYLDSIFGGGEEKPKQEKKKKKAGVVADVEEADARTLFDLGTAYREMGLVDAAIAQFEAAAKDPSWSFRALVMLGTLRVHRGETDEAVENLRSALEAAETEDERSHASYELGVLYEKVGQTVAAIEQLQAVSAGFRDRDERLQALLEQ